MTEDAQDNAYLSSMHRLIQRQALKHLSGVDMSHITAFIHAVNGAYLDYENDHNQLERTLELSSNELYKANAALNEVKNSLEHNIDQLKSTNKELDQFAYVVAHDLKAPLRAISNLSIWIEEDIEELIKDDTKQNFNLLRGRIQRMESLINGILEYSRAGRMQSSVNHFEVYTSVKEVVNVLTPPNNFKIEIQPDLPEITTDKLKLEQVFSNFISNAIKYNNNPNPTINIGYTEDLTHYTFWVEDNGPGIAPDYHEKIFIIFQTLQARDTFESTGVGLAIVKKIIEDAGGLAWVESELGKGCKFYFSLPKIAA